MGGSRRAVALLAVAALLTGCWRSTSTLAVRDGRTWTETRVVEEETDARIAAEAVEEDEGWEARFDVEIADTCVEEEFVEVEKVETTVRTVDSRTVAIPLIAGILVSLATPVAAVYTAQNGDPIFDEPVAQEDLLIFLGVGEGIAGGLIGAGAITIGVTRDGAGVHEEILDSDRELRGQVDAPGPCRWRALNDGTLVLTPDGGESVETDVVRGVAVMPLPEPSAKAPLAWDVELVGVGERIRLDLSRGDYADRSHLARVDAHLKAGHLYEAVADLRDVRPKARGLDEMRARVGELAEASIEDDLRAGDAVEALDILDQAGDLYPGGDDLWVRTVGAAAESRLRDGDLKGAVETAGRLVERVGPEAPEVVRLRKGVEGSFADLLARGAFEDAGQAAERAEPLMGPGWALGARERTLAMGAVAVIAQHLRGDHPDGPISVPASAVAALADVADRILDARGDREALHPPGTAAPERALADAAAGLVERRGFEGRFKDSKPVAADPDREWLEAAETFLVRFEDHPAADSLRASVPKAREERQKTRALRADFDSFSDAFGRAAAQNYLASKSGKVDAISPGWGPCREGRDFLKKHGPSTYRRMASTYCKATFPSTWVHGEGSWNEVSGEVPVRACEAFFKAPRGCDR